ncbi:MAG: hypothetical protein ACTSUE_06585 [Promethearchaeota archaeon]
MKELIMNQDELQILLNKKRFFDISFPAYRDFTLAHVSQRSMGYKISVPAVDFRRLAPGSSLKRNENPTYSDFRECFLATGLITYENLADLSRKIKNYSRIHRKVYISFDTNILYNQFLSSSPLKEKQMVVTQTVRDEIAKHVNHKFTHEQIADLKENADGHPDLYDVLEKRRVKKSRKVKYFALRELNRLNLIEADTVDFKPTDYEGLDTKIAKELHKFQRQTQSIVFFLTADDTMQDCCELENLDHLRLIYPKGIKTVEASPDQLRYLIFNLAVLFGFIQIGGKFTIFGEFRGKINPGDMKVRISKEGNPARIEKELRICRKLLALGI